MAISNQPKTASIAWRDDRTPVATDFDDPYFSLDNGLAETTHVFLAGNALPDRFRDGLHIAELGFGTGLNFLATWRAWIASGTAGRFHFTSFEAFPMSTEDMQRALANWPELSDLAGQMVVGLDKSMIFETDQTRLEVILGDARKTLPAWQGHADVWYLDGFSPAKNPELWGRDLMAAVGAHTAPEGSFATYSAAGHVRQSLTDAGFDVSRTPGYGRKRHMTTGVKRHATPEARS
jgi:tRNA U34 5-methylaminomethyl-2-thiouridine-forming methyltransferase MnmC